MPIRTEDVWAAVRPNVDTCLPTLGIFAAALLTAVTAIWGHYTASWGDGIVVSLLTLTSYMMFTVMHEASHGSVFPNPLPNRIIGLVAGVFLGPTSSFSAYRALHLDHHRFTNDPARDPDWYSGRGPRWWLPISWLTTDFYYYWFYLRTMNSRPWPERIQVTLENVCMLLLFASLCMTGHTREALLYWLLPSRFATGLLAFGFNFLPHWPYACRASEDPWRATRILWPESAIARILLQGHNLHLIHHLFPGIPFYLYPRVWRRYRDVIATRLA